MGRWAGRAGLSWSCTLYGRRSIRADAAPRPRRSVGVVPYGGGTGLVGGQVLSAWPLAGAADFAGADGGHHGGIYPGRKRTWWSRPETILSGCPRCRRAAAQHRLFPLVASPRKGSCPDWRQSGDQRGGCECACATAMRAISVPGARGGVCQVVEIWHGLKRLRKDNTGYDLKNLLIGSEGTLGDDHRRRAETVSAPGRRSGTALIQVVDGPEAAICACWRWRAIIVGEGCQRVRVDAPAWALEFLRQTICLTCASPLKRGRRTGLC